MLHLLEDLVLQRLIETLSVSDGVMLVGAAGLQLYLRLAQCRPLLHWCHNELIIQSQHLQGVTCASNMHTQLLEIDFKGSMGL